MTRKSGTKAFPCILFAVLESGPLLEVLYRTRPYRLSTVDRGVLLATHLLSAPAVISKLIIVSSKVDSIVFSGSPSLEDVLELFIKLLQCDNWYITRVVNS